MEWTAVQRARLVALLPYDALFVIQCVVNGDYGRMLNFRLRPQKRRASSSWFLRTKPDVTTTMKRPIKQFIAEACAGVFNGILAVVQRDVHE